MKITKATLKRLIKEELSAIQEMDMEDDFDTMSREVHEEVAKVIAMMKQELSGYDPETHSVEDLGNLMGLADRLNYLYDVYIPGDDVTDSATKGHTMKKYRKSFSPLGYADSPFD